MSNRKISVCLSPALIQYYNLENTIAVVIDVFRATSSICYGLSNGAQAIIPVSEIEACSAYADRGYLLAAEREGKAVEGFDFGNSPFSYTAEKVKGKTIVLTTTNGTRAIRLCEGADDIVAGSFGNLSVLSNWLRGLPQDVLFVCAGWKNHPNLEDTVFAGAVIDNIRDESSELDDSAWIAAKLHAEGRGDLLSFLAKAQHAQRMKQLDVTKDIAFSLTPDLSPVIPILRGEKLVVLEH